MRKRKEQIKWTHRLYQSYTTRAYFFIMLGVWIRANKKKGGHHLSPSEYTVSICVAKFPIVQLHLISRTELHQQRLNFLVELIFFYRRFKSLFRQRAKK